MIIVNIYLSCANKTKINQMLKNVMKITQSVIYTLFSVLYTSISFAQERVEPLRIPLHQSRGANAEDLFLSVKYIPLESTKNAMIQEVDDFWATDNEVIVFDRRGKAILFFGSDGQFKHKIDKVPNCAPCNRADILFSSVFINKEKREIYAIYGTTMDNVTMGIFDFDGKFLGQKKEWYTLEGMGFLGNSILMANYLFDEGKLDNIQFFHHNETIAISSFDPKLKADYTSFPNRISKSSYNGKLYWSEPYENKIYSIDSNAHISETKLIFPLQYSLPNDFVKNNHGKINEVLKSTYPNAIFGITHIMEFKNYMILNLMSHIALNGLSSVLLNLDTGEVYDLNQVKPTALNSYMPISSAGNQSFFLDSNGGQLYSLIYPHDLLVHYSEADMMEQLNKAPSYVNKIVTKRDVFKNPILVVSSMK